MTDGSPQAPRTDALSRNAACPCGSGKKYKQCCGALAGHTNLPTPQGAAADRQAAQLQFRRGVQLLQTAQVAAAIPAFMDAIRLDRDYFDAHHGLASALMRSGRFGDAIQILSRAVALKPGSAPAWQDLGTSFDRLGQFDNAIDAYRRAVALSPKLTKIHCRLAELYEMHSRTDEAGDAYDRAADADPDTAQARLYRSDARLLRGDMPGAEHWAREAIVRDPGSGAAHGTLAGVLYAQGRFRQAEQSFEAALSLNPKAGRCWYGLSQCRRFSSDDSPVLERLRRVLASTDLSDGDRMMLHFAIGKMHDDRGEYAEAMQQFDAANVLRGRMVTFDRAAFAALVDRNTQRYTRAFIDSPRWTSQDQTPLFIVGMYRSGTTLVEQIVSSHPGVAAGGELTVWTPSDLETPSATADFDPERSRAAIEKYLGLLKRVGPSAARVSDKLPFNFLRLGAIHALMPKARIIHCRRDPIDTCLSIYMNLFKTRVNFAARKGDLAFCYRQYLRLMEHWRNVLPPDIFLEVDYDRLIVDREAETRRMIAFIGLDWDNACLAPERNERTIGTASAWQARQPVYASSVQRWRHYEPWLGELRELLPAQN